MDEFDEILTKDEIRCRKAWLFMYVVWQLFLQFAAFVLLYPLLLTDYQSVDQQFIEICLYTVVLYIGYEFSYKKQGNLFLYLLCVYSYLWAINTIQTLRNYEFDGGCAAVLVIICLYWCFVGFLSFKLTKINKKIKGHHFSVHSNARQKIG